MQKLKVSKRVNSLIESPIRKFLPLVREAEKKGVKFFKLNVGDPDIFAPNQILNEIRNYRHKNIPYAPSSGIVEHVQAWIKYYAGFGLRLESKNIIPTQGAAEAILISLMAVSDPGDEIIVFEPLYASYKGFAALANVKLVPVSLKLKNNFDLPGEQEIIKKITKKTKAIVVINPDNPTGKVWSDKELKSVIKIARKYNLFIMADETYREIVFQGQVRSLLSYKIDNLIIIDSLSKRFSVPGMRIGAMVSYNKDIMRAVLKTAMVRLSVPTVGQLATVNILKNARVYTSKIRDEYKRRRDAVNAELAKINGVEFHQPQGAFYQVVKLPVKDSEDFIKFLITKFRYKNRAVLIAPMEDFYITPGKGRDEIRIAYVLNIKELKEAMEVLRRGLEMYKK